MAAESQDVDTARLETFADGVMAIAITLLILEIDVPHVRAGESLGAALAEQWPSYVAYVVSFLTIGIMWVNHHHMFQLIERTTHTFLVLNVVFLMTIAFLPWPTALVAAYIEDPARRPVAAFVYGGTMVAIAIMFNVVWRYAAHEGRLVSSHLDEATLRRWGRNYLAGPTIYTAGTLLALVSPLITLVIFAALALYWLLPGTGPRAGGAERPRRPSEARRGSPVRRARLGEAAPGGCRRGPPSSPGGPGPSRRPRTGSSRRPYHRGT